MLSHKIKGQEFVSTYDYHKNRESAHHIDQTGHALRLLIAASMAEYLRKFCNVNSIVDLGCGDGGLAEYLTHKLDFENVLGYDFTPANVNFALNERNVKVKNENFLENIEKITNVDLTIMTEVLEHVEDPYDIVKKISSPYIIASSPSNETINVYDSSHRWVWDEEGYIELFERNKFRIIDKVYTNTTLIVMAAKI